MYADSGINNNLQHGTTRVSIVSICQSINVTPEFLNEKNLANFIKRFEVLNGSAWLNI